MTMDNSCYKYKGKWWRPFPTKKDNNSFFHSAFGTKDQEDGTFIDKHAQFRRMRWATFLTYFANEIMPPRLADILKKCFAANDKYKHASIDDKENLMRYVSDIVASERNVTIEEIPILATLENVEVVVLSNTEPCSVITIKPNPSILGSYTNLEKAKEKVVLSLEGGIFSKLKPVTEDSTPKPDEIRVDEKNVVQVESFFGRYKKGGSAGSKGVQYQVNLLAIVLLNAFRNLSEWKLSTENEEAGKFDDIVLEETGGTTFIQSKHKEKKWRKITLDELISTNSKNDDFSLPKYFLSYLQIKKKFKIKNVILCTNANIHKRSLKFLDYTKSHSGSILHYDKGDYCFCTLKYEVLPDLKESIKSYYRQNFKNKGIVESEINDENLKDFQKHLHLYFNYASLNRMEKIVDKSLSLIRCCNSSSSKIFSSEIYLKMMEWYQKEEGTYLTQTHARAMFSEIWREKYCQELEEYDISFHRDDLNFQQPTQIFHVITNGGYLLQVIKIYHAIRDDKTKILFVHLHDDIDIQKQAVEAFELPKYTFLIIIWTQTTKESATMEAFGKLKGILKKCTYKKIIVVAEDDRFVQRIGWDKDVVRVSKPMTFQDFHPSSQERLLKKRNIIFQGKNVSLEGLMKTQNIEEYRSALNTEILERLLRGEKIKVGVRPSRLDDYIGRYYISRTFRRKIDKIQDETWNNGEIIETLLDDVRSSKETTRYYKRHTLKEEILDTICNDEMKQEENISEENLYYVKEKVIVISDSAGMGKSTVLVKLAITIKQNHPHLWVLRIELNRYTKVLRNALRKGETTVDIMALLNSAKTTKFTNHLEEFVFSAGQNVVLMLDGMDEISPDYTALILSLLKQCQERHNFVKIFVTTRPDVTRELEEVLGVQPFVLQPFTESDQIDFLTNYWLCSMQIKGDLNKEKCRRYAKALIGKWMNLDNDEGNKFATVPLQIRMMAEIFQDCTQWDESVSWDGREKFVSESDAEPNMSEKMDIAKLCELFIKKKGHIFTEKANPIGNVVANHSVTETFHECLIYHRNFALEVILGEDRLHLFSSYRRGDKNIETKMLKIGIVQKLDEKLHFIHRTFADYFVAECLLTELRRSQSLEFQTFLIDTIFLHPQYNLTRVFFDCFLRNVVDSLPSDIFEKYQSLKQECSLKSYALQSYLIHILSKEGCAAILRLILKCTRFQIIRNKEINTVDSYKTNTDADTRNNIFGNTLNVLQYHTRQAGINIQDRRGHTPLHLAAKNGRLEMVKFLIERGANVNIRSNFGHTALHSASVYGHLDVINYLIKNEADINIKDSNGRTALHVAAQFGHLATVKFLVEYLSNLNTTCRYSRTLLHLSSMNGHLDIVRYLLELGVDPKVRDDYKCTALHLAVRYGQLDTVKFFADYGLEFNVASGNGSTLLHGASANGHLDVVKYLIETGADVSAKDNNGRTALHVAAQFGRLETARFLIGYTPDLNATCRYGRTLLHLSSMNGHLDTVRYLLELGIDPNTRDNFDCTALHLAVRYGQLDTVKFFVEYGLDLNVTNSSRFTLLHGASANGHLHIIKYLIEIGSDPDIKDSNGRTALYVAAQFDHLETVKFLVKYAPNVNDTCNCGRTLLHLSSLNGNLEAVQFLLSLGADLNPKDNNKCTPLHLAARYGHADTVKHLLLSGADFTFKDDNDFTALHLAAYYSQLNTIKFLINYGVDFNDTDRYGRTLLHLSSMNGRLDTVRFLLEHGLNCNARDNFGSTPLHLAARYGRVNTVKYLVVFGVDVTIRNNNGFTALHMAAYFNHLNVIKFFVEYGLDFNDTSNDGCSLLHLASGRGHSDTVRYLLELGVDSTIRNGYGFTALHMAAYFDHLSTVKILVERGLDLNVTSSDGSSLLLLASEKGHLDVVEYLLELGVDDSLRSNDGSTALQIAAYYGHSNIVKFFVEYGLDPNITNSYGSTLLHLAIVSGCLETTKYLVELGIDPSIRDADGFTALQTAVCFKNFNIVKFLVDYGLDFNVTSNFGRTLLHSASEYGQLEIEEFILELDVELDARDNDGFTALHLAAQYGHLGVVKLLADGGADLNIRGHNGRTVLHLASEYGHLDTVEFLLQLVDNNVNKRDNDGFTALHLAARYGQLNVVRFLANHCLDFNVTSSYGYTPLHLASENDHLDTVEFLLEAGADVTIRDGDGFTALQTAVYFGRLDIVKFFLKCGLNFNVTDNYGGSLLHSAGGNGHLEMVKFLLQIGVDCDLRNDSGRTALHLAAQAGHLDVVRLFVEFGADLNIRDDKGRTALHLAIFEGYLSTAKFLIEEEAPITPKSYWLELELKLCRQVAFFLREK